MSRGCPFLGTPRHSWHLWHTPASTTSHWFQPKGRRSIPHIRKIFIVQSFKALWKQLLRAGPSLSFTELLCAGPRAGRGSELPSEARSPNPRRRSDHRQEASLGRPTDRAAERMRAKGSGPFGSIRRIQNLSAEHETQKLWRSHVW